MTITPTPQWPALQSPQVQPPQAEPPQFQPPQVQPPPGQPPPIPPPPWEPYGPPPTAARKPPRRMLWLLAGIAVVLALAAVVVAVLLTRGGGDEPGTVTSDSGATYQVVGVTVAETAQEAEDTGLIPLGPGQYLYEPAGSYVIVEWAVSGSTEDAGTTAVLVDGNGSRQESGLTAFSLDVDTEEVTQVDVYDVPDDAVAGSQLVVLEGGTGYTLDLGL